jgi:hypothetical protein
MQPLKLIIPGSFYDSLLYKGRLYLWDAGGEHITAIDWDKLVTSIEVTEGEKLPMVCGFKESNRLYKSQDELLYGDPDFRQLLTSKFASLADKGPRNVEAEVRACTLRVQPNPFMFPHSEAIAYYDIVYVASQAGVQNTSCSSKKAVNPIRTNPTTTWSGRATGIAPSYGHLAVCAGSEGLIDVRLSRDLFQRPEPEVLSTSPTTFAAWTYWCIFAGSFSSGAYLATFTEPGKTPLGEPRPDRPESGRTDLRIDFVKTIGSAEIFGTSMFAWGRHDKLCQIQDGHAAVVRHVPWAKEPEARFVPLGRVALGKTYGELVSADSALFGFVLEFDQGIKVLQSDNEVVAIPGEPVNWRVFPRSVSYENQLHILYDDRLEVWSFNNDYLVNQDTKIAGVKYNPNAKPQ